MRLWGQHQYKAGNKEKRKSGGWASVIYLSKGREIMVPVYADLRLPLAPDAEIMPQPGYNLYNALFAGTSGNPFFRFKENTKGTLYIAGGITAY